VIEPHPFARTGRPVSAVPVEGLRLLAPVIPSKVVCVGRNYADHAAELGNEVPDRPCTSSSPRRAVIGPGEAIRLPTDLASTSSATRPSSRS
jgi:2-keto-4-pentenoate hydratase/2-oxohepta-3-ene-1,7-dioic acid hydratase in catechol pathway